VSRFHISEVDLEAVERLLAATLAHCHKLRDQQRHNGAAASASGALRLLRTLRATQADHGFFADFITRPYDGLFEEFV
jgi:hypothetical protein